ncbi:hypothetical protein [Candidatus Poriferisodalis sp.]|uniref:hypothetical protein n=1 Tax=Candidatus Poriferisodalis sp. TaxID=3101277 RepID=UPI003B51908B
MDDLRLVKVRDETTPVSLGSKRWYGDPDTYDVTFELNRSVDSDEPDILTTLWQHAMRATTDAAPDTTLKAQANRIILVGTTFKDVEEWQLDLLRRVIATANEQARVRRGEKERERQAEEARQEARGLEAQQSAMRINQLLADD